MKRIVPVILVFLFCAGFAAAQSMRATLTGRVTDPTGAIVPNAKIVVTDTQTGAKTIVTSNNAGVYTALFLPPGTYSIQVTRAGFKTFLHTDLKLNIMQTITENVVLQVGNVNQTVTVRGGTPLIDIASANVGGTLTSAQAEQLPSNGRAPMGFAHLLFGAVAKGKHSMIQMRPFDNSAASDFSLGGGNSQSNEILLNGVPNMEDGGRVAAFSPELDAVQSVHVQEWSANADQGDTSGGIIDITTKAGTNHYHGTASEFYGGSRPLTARTFFTPSNRKVPSVHYNQFGATLGGPVRIPHLYNGHNKFFFFYSLEGYKGNSPGTVITSVPTQAEREGDFHSLLALNPDYQLYNPFTAYLSGTGSNTEIERHPIPNNCLTDTSSYCATHANAGLHLSPVAQAYMKLMPLPNFSGASTAPDGENNYYAADPTSNNYFSNEARFDYNFSPSNKAYVEFHRSTFIQAGANVFGNSLTGFSNQTNLLGGQVNDVENFSPTLSLETRLGFSRYVIFGGPNSLGQPPTSLGFPGYMASNSTQLALPVLFWADGANIPTLSNQTNTNEHYDDIQLFTEFTKVWGKHTFKFGTDWRANKESLIGHSYANGYFGEVSTNNDFVTANSGVTGVHQPFGGAFALFDLGLPSFGGYQIQAPFQYNNWYFAEFFQDDYKMLPNLTISYGIRIDHETPVTESNNRMVIGFNPTAVNGSTDAAEAAYAAIPNKPSVLPASISPTGTIVYATSGNRHAYSTAAVYLSPRLGFAYAPGFGHGKLSIRGGFGVYVNPFGDYPFAQSYGYSQSTNETISNNDNLTPATTLDNPFPASSPIIPVLGDTLGGNTQLGNGVSFYDPNDKVPYSEKWTLDIEKQFARVWMVEIGYMGMHEVHDSYTNNLSKVPFLPLLVHSEFPDKALTDELNAPIANPFQGTMPGTAQVPNTTGLNTGSKVSVAGLLNAYPEYGGVSEGLIPGAYENFNALLFKLGTEMWHGLTVTYNYEYSRQLGAVTQLNQGGPLWYGETTSDFPNHSSVMLTYELPYGKGRAFAPQSTFLNEVFGGYTITSIYQYLSGTPVGWGNVNYTGNFHDFNSNPGDYLTPSFNTSNFNTNPQDQPNGYNYRTFPQYLLRTDPTNDIDMTMLKNFPVGDRMVIQPRFDAFNAFNRPQFTGPNTNPTSKAFGRINGQLNQPRELQLGIHILF
jgi:hypothetical protein